MRKAIIISLAVAVAFTMSGVPALADTDVTTGLTKSIGGEDNPIIKAKWEMNYNASLWGNIEDTDPGPNEAYEWTSMTSDGVNPGQDDRPSNVTDAGAQFDPSGAYQVSKWIMICAIATDPLGVDDINNVYATVYYPESIYLGDDHESGRQGCGERHGNQIQLVQLSKNDGIELFCNNIRGGNYTLPTFNTVEANPTTGAHFNYGEICGTEGHLEDGELWKETAYVYCKYKELSYEDPSGMYEVSVYADDNKGLESARLVNEFEYVEMTAFETDFDEILYGNVGLNVHKIISGDTNFDSGGATVRNVGNTRLNMIVWQDDMGLGQRDNGAGSIWNVEWDARVGSSVDYQNYFPNYVYDPESFGTGKVLDDALDLSETNEMDFSILVSKFHGYENQADWSGHMVLGALSADHLPCPAIVGADLESCVQPTGNDCDVTVSSTIQAGVNAATSGQTVCVPDGTYNEDVLIDEEITLAGAGASDTSTINGNVTIKADNVTLQGFEINGSVSVWDYGNVTVACNKVTTDAGNGIVYGHSGLGSGNPGGTVTHNEVSTPGKLGIYLDRDGTTDFAVTNNTVAARKAIGFGSLSGGVAERNSVSSTQADIEVFDADQVTVNTNNLSGMVIDADAGSDVLDAENNWWGDTNPADQVTGDVDYTPWESSAYPEY